MIYLQGKQNRIWDWNGEDFMHFILNSLTGLADGSAYVFSKQFLKFVKRVLSQGEVSFGTLFKPYCLYSVYERKLYLWSILY